VVAHQICVEGIITIDWDGTEDWKGKELDFGLSGRDAGEEKELESRNGGGVTFTSSHECRGTFYCEFESSDGWEFVGRKVSNKVPEYSVEYCRALADQDTSGARKGLWSWHLELQPKP